MFLNSTKNLYGLNRTEWWLPDPVQHAILPPPSFDSATIRMVAMSLFVPIVQMPRTLILPSIQETITKE